MTKFVHPNIVHPLQYLIALTKFPYHGNPIKGGFGADLNLAEKITEANLRAFEKLIKESDKREQDFRRSPRFTYFCRMNPKIAFRSLACLLARGDDTLVAQALSLPHTMNALGYQNSLSLLQAFRYERDLITVIKAPYVSSRTGAIHKQPALAEFFAHVIDGMEDDTRFNLLTNTPGKLCQAFQKLGYENLAAKWRYEVILRQNRASNHRRGHRGTSRARAASEAVPCLA